MEETTNSIKDAIKERLTNPFLGKLLLAWVIWNWKIPYISFFVSEENIIPPEGIESTNKLEFVSDYLAPDSFWDFCNIYLVPLLITAIFIWVVPWLSDIVLNVSEKYRLKKALRIRKTDNEISSFIDKKIKDLSDRLKSIIEQKSLLETFCSHLIDERKDLFEKGKISDEEFFKLFHENINHDTVKERVFHLIDDYNKSSSKSSFLESLNHVDKHFLMNSAIIKKEENRDRLVLSDFGSFISKKRTYNSLRRFGNLNNTEDFK